MQILSSFQLENPLGILRGPTLVLTVLERFRCTVLPELGVECQGNKASLHLGTLLPRSHPEVPLSYG